ncbi:MAG: hypothetical protein AVDCRST_MAG77-2651 [uncultured Chloroflexi bacterium]|uniref:Uncharacterized protein n=1 Tax=uncultured Chloroflexota bacterium TaxID=166587 RepID=A0A6J4IU72_9CHLR|nr:MAG: hypothetical protein AVDCRST_MAG77-2651 [uncultured Chloroflexota bacterium]
MATKHTTKKTAKTEPASLPVWLTIVAETAASRRRSSR